MTPKNLKERKKQLKKQILRIKNTYPILWENVRPKEHAINEIEYIEEMLKGRIAELEICDFHGKDHRCLLGPFDYKDCDGKNKKCFAYEENEITINEIKSILGDCQACGGTGEQEQEGAVDHREVEPCAECGGGG